MLSMREVCRFAHCSPSSRNFTEGEKLLNTGHLIKCGRRECRDGEIEIVGYCLQTSGKKSMEQSHTIYGLISADSIKKMQCSCKTEISEKCKHILSVLLFLNRTKLPDLEIFSSTDIKYARTKAQTEALQEDDIPLEEHKCLKESFKNKIVISEETRNEIKELLLSNPSSALSKFLVGRHPPVTVQSGNFTTVDQIKKMSTIVYRPTSSILYKISNIPIFPLKSCCSTFLTRLNDDPLEICTKTSYSSVDRQKQRQFRITGSRCYHIYTKTTISKPNWDLTSFEYFYAKDIKTAAVKHSIINEPNALKAYGKLMNVEVTTCGLIICDKNPWLGYSPSGVIIKDDKIQKLIEIKCPESGIKNTIAQVIENAECLEKCMDGSWTLKKQHAYYAQVQLGMVILNTTETDFILYASFDSSLCIINVKIDIEFITNMLQALQNVYFSHMIHTVCRKEKSRVKINK